MSRPVSRIQKELGLPFLSILSLPATAMGFALSVQISSLSWILSTKYGLNLEEIGWVWAAGPIAGIFGQIPGGLLSDNIWFMNGRRRPMIIIGGILAAAMLLCLPSLDLISEALGIEDIIFVALVVALVLDLAINVGFGPTRSIIADCTPEGEYRTRGFTMMQTISGAFGVAAYLIGAFIDNYTLIYTGVGLTLLFTLIPPFFITEPRNLSYTDDAPLPDDKQSAQRGVKPKTNIAQLLGIYAAHSFSWLGIQSMFVYLFAYVKQTMEITDDKELGMVPGISFAVLNTVGFLLPALVLEPLSKKIGRVKTHTVCIGIMALSYFGVLLVGNSFTGLYLAMAFIGIGWAAVVSLPFAIMSEYVNKARMGLWMGIFNLSVVLPQLVVSSIFGRWFDNTLDKSIIIVVCGASLAISAILWGILVKEKQHG